MPVSWVATGTLEATTGGADVTPVNPAHVADDILLLVSSARVGGALETMATPAGWTLTTFDGTSGSWRTYYCWKRATSSAETDPLCDWVSAVSDKYAVVHTLRGASKTANPPYVPGAGIVTAAIPDAQNVTPGVDGCLIVVAGMASDDVQTGVSALSASPGLTMTTNSYSETTIGADAAQFIMTGQSPGSTSQFVQVDTDGTNPPFLSYRLFAFLPQPSGSLPARPRRIAHLLGL